VLESALEVARTVAAAAPVATRLTKAALGSGGPETFESALAWEAIAQPVTLAMEDLQEGLAAAQQKRPPIFTGR
jgi:enoyl-CoA hydratase